MAMDGVRVRSSDLHPTSIGPRKPDPSTTAERLIAMNVTDKYELREYGPGEALIAADIRGLTQEEDRLHLQELIDSDPEWKGHYHHLALARDGKVIGDIQLRRCHYSMPPGVVHVGVEILESERGTGAGTRALELLWEWAQARNFHRIEGSTESSNLAMQRVFSKVGWNFEGILKSYFIEDGVAKDYLSYSKTL